MTYDVDLCHGPYGVGDAYPNAGYRPDSAPEDYRRLRAAAGDDPQRRREAIQATAPALYFVCADRANGVTSFPCTGGAHPAPGVHVICSCDCHKSSYSAVLPLADSAGAST